jgi:hypothetical protein
MMWSVCLAIRAIPFAVELTIHNAFVDQPINCGQKNLSQRCVGSASIRTRAAKESKENVSLHCRQSRPT